MHDKIYSHVVKDLSSRQIQLNQDIKETKNIPTSKLSLTISQLPWGPGQVSLITLPAPLPHDHNSLTLITNNQTYSILFSYIVYVF